MNFLIALSWDEIKYDWIGFWMPIVFMGVIAWFIWRTFKLMPKTKPQEIKPDSEG